MRVLITGSRSWTDRTLIECAIEEVVNNSTERVILVHGACPTGADYFADLTGQKLGLEVERYPAQWSKYGKNAGFKRNKYMIDTKPDLLLAFIKNESNGATHCRGLATLNNIETITYTQA